MNRLYRHDLASSCLIISRALPPIQAKEAGTASHLHHGAVAGPASTACTVIFTMEPSPTQPLQRVALRGGKRIPPFAIYYPGQPAGLTSGFPPTRPLQRVALRGGERIPPCAIYYPKLPAGFYLQVLSD